MKCPVCESSLLYPFLRREQVPVHQHLLLKEQALATRIERGNLQLVVCQQCGFIFNAEFELSKLTYGPDYDSTQLSSPLFGGYVEDLARYLTLEKEVHNSRILEVGCGKGHFLRRLVEADGSGNTGYGFDPSYVGPPTALGGRLQFQKRFFDAEVAGIPVDVVICRHVIEHVPEPLPLLRAIRKALIGSPRPRVFFETPSVEWILRNGVFWDFFYEHCSYFSEGSLSTAFALSGFQVTAVRRVFGDQYVWLEATVAPANQTALSSEVGSVVSLCQRFSGTSAALIDKWKAELRRLARTGSVALWGAGAKGVTVANLVDPDRTLIACVVDLNPQKVGGFVPGTGHPIVSYVDLPAHRVSTAILMNPNYRDENLTMLREAQLDVTLIDPSQWGAVDENHD